MQRLIFAGKQLGNARTLGYYGVQEGSVIYVLLKIKNAEST